MTIRNTSRDANGQAGSPQQDHSEDQGRRLARVTARQLRRAPGVPASGARFLVAHAFWILAVTIAVVGAAAALVFSQKPLYKAQAVVAVQQAAVAASSGNPPNMATEEDVATSGAVLAMASRLLNVPVATLASGVSVHVPSTTTLLQIAYTDPVPRIAQQRAQAIAQAYIHYRSPQPAAPAKNPAKSAPLSTTPTAVLVTPALLPTSPASPDYMIDMGAALIVGLALGLGTAWLRDRMDDRLRGPHDLEAQAGAPVLALIPAFRTGRNCGGRATRGDEPGLCGRGGLPRPADAGGANGDLQERLDAACHQSGLGGQGHGRGQPGGRARAVWPRRGADMRRPAVGPGTQATRPGEPGRCRRAPRRTDKPGGSSPGHRSSRTSTAPAGHDPDRPSRSGATPQLAHRAQCAPEACGCCRHRSSPDADRPGRWPARRPRRDGSGRGGRAAYQAGAVASRHARGRACAGQASRMRTGQRGQAPPPARAPTRPDPSPCPDADAAQRGDATSQ